MKASPRKVLYQVVDTIAIVGTHPDTREQAPWDDDNTEIWVFNEVAGQRNTWVKRWDAIFQMHPPTIYRNPKNRCDPQHWNWLQQDHGKPVYMLEVDEQVPDSVAYPLEEITEALLPGFTQGSEQVRRQYFTSTIAYSLALAIMQDPEHIEVYGVEMSSNTEYTWQRDCVAFWVGLALGRGIEVKYSGGKAIFERPLYGYDGSIEVDIDAMVERKDELDESLEEAIKERQRLERVMRKRWDKSPAEHIGNLRDAKSKEGALSGHLHELERYLHKARAMKAETDLAIIDRNEYEGAAAATREKIERFGALVHESAGRIGYVLNVWLKIQDPEALRQCKMFCDEHYSHAFDSGFAQGVYAENLRLAQELDYHLTAAGGTKALAMLVEGLPTPARPVG